MFHNNTYWSGAGGWYQLVLYSIKESRCIIWKLGLCWIHCLQNMSRNHSNKPHLDCAKVALMFSKFQHNLVYRHVYIFITNFVFHKLH